MSEAAMQSETLGKLGEALAKAQSVMTGAKKDRQNPHFKSNYADLASIWDACREPLGTNGLSVIQQVTTTREGVKIVSTLLHVSGEFIRDECWLPVATQTPQAYGSAITYARRYSLAAIVGVAAEDDDGNAGSAQGFAAPKAAPRVESNYTARGAVNQKTGEVPFDPEEESLAVIAASTVYHDPEVVQKIVDLGVGKRPRVRTAYENKQRELAPKQGAA